MQRRLLFDLLFIWVLSLGIAIFIAIGMNALRITGTLQPVVFSLLVLLMGSIVGVFALTREASTMGGKVWLFVSGFGISLSCALLFLKLFEVLQDVHGSDMRILQIVSLIALPLTTLIAAAITALVPALKSSGARTVQAEGFSDSKRKHTDISIDDIIIKDPDLVCPLCRTRPYDSNQVMIRCPSCNSYFCSRQLKDLKGRCYKCRAIIPFTKEIEVLVSLRKM